MNKYNDHDFFKDRLSAYFDQELKNEELAIVQEHLDSCSECQSKLAEFEKFEQMVEANSQLFDDDYWEKSAQKIEAALEQPVETVITPVEPKPMTGLWWKLTAAAASVAIIAFVAMYEKDITDYNYYDGEIAPMVVPVDSSSDTAEIRGGRVEAVAVEKADDSLVEIKGEVIKKDSDITVRTGAGITKVDLKDSSRYRESDDYSYVINPEPNPDKTINVSADKLTDKLLESSSNQPVIVKKDKGTAEISKPEIDGLKIETAPAPVSALIKKQATPEPASDETAQPAKKQATPEKRSVNGELPTVEKQATPIKQATPEELDKIKQNIIPGPVTAFRAGEAQDVALDNAEDEKDLTKWQAELKRLTRELKQSSDKSREAKANSFSATKSGKDKKAPKTTSDTKPVSTEMNLKLMECHYNIARLTIDTKQYNKSYNYLVDKSWDDEAKIADKAEEYLKLLDEMK